MATLPPPAGVVAGLDPTAVMGRRIGAYLIDAVIGWVVMGLVFWSVSDVLTSRGFLSCDDDGAPALCLQYGDTIRFAEGGDARLVTLSAVLVWALMGIVIQGLTGGTPGKLMVGLRVVRRDDGNLAGIGRCAARTVLWLVDAFPYVIPLVGLITGVVTKGHRRVGDMAAGTLVVRSTAVGAAPVVSGLTVAPATAWAPPPGTVPGGWVPPTGPPAQAPPPADFADPFAAPAGQVFPAPDRITPDTGSPPPASPPTVPPAAMDEPPPAPLDDQPRWDPQRNAYVWFDRQRDQWLVHDAASGQWRPL